MTEYRQIYPQRSILINDTDDGLNVNQQGTGNIFDLEDNGSSVFRVADGGAITTTGAWSTSGLITWTAGAAITAASYQIGRDTDGTNQLHFNIPTGATFEWSINDVAELLLSATNFTPGTNDGNALGSGTVSWADLFLADGGIINFNNGNVTLTHSAGILTTAGLTLIDVAAGILELNNAVRFDTGVAIVAGSYSVGRDADGTNQLHLNVPTGATIEFSVNDVAELLLSATDLNLNNNTLSNIGAAGNDILANALTMSNASGATNMVLTVENTSNTAATAEHSIVDIRIGGTTTTGKPQLRLTTPGGTSWYLAGNVSEIPAFNLGTGTIVGSGRLLAINARTSGAADFSQFQFNADTPGVTLDNSASARLRNSIFWASVATLAGTTTVTQLWDFIAIDRLIIAQSGGAVTVNAATGLSIFSPRPNASVTITASSAVRILDTGAPGGTLTSQYGIYIEALSSGSNDYGVYVANADTYAFFADAGASRFDGTAEFQSSIGVGFAGASTGSGINVGAASTNNSIWNASQGAASTTLYIGNASINVTSDMRLKTHIHTWQGSALDLLRQAHIVEFSWDDPSDRNPYGKGARGQYVGMLAQETIQWAPWIINAGNGRSCQRCVNGRSCEDHMYWQVEYEHLVPLAVKGVQELETRLICVEKKLEQASNDRNVS